MNGNKMTSTSRLIRKAGVFAAVSSLALVMSCTWAMSSEKRQKYDIPAQPLSSALLAFSKKTNLNIVASGEAMKGKFSEAMVGEYSIDEALKNLLGSSGITYEYRDDKTILIRPQAFQKESYRADSSSSQFAMNQQSGRQSDAAQNKSAPQNNAPEKDEEDIGLQELEEIVVTGSNIRGIQSASPVQTFSRDLIDNSGYATTHQFLQTLPQNFAGGASEANGSLSPGNGANLNTSQGSGINLRGQGTDSTLILLDGRRLSAAGLGQFVDVSLIPVAAIESVAVLTDGASAIYGSDAVGGVVNFQLRKDYDGAETRLRYGSATSGDADEFSAAQTFGTVWDSGHAMLSYEYYQRDPLDAKDRSFSSDAKEPTYLLPKQKRHSVFFTGEQEVADTVEVFGTAFYSKRDGRNFTELFNLFVADSTSSTEQYGGTFGVAADLTSSWRAELVGTFNEVKTYGKADLFPIPYNPSDTPIPQGESDLKSNTWEVDAKADGTLVEWAGGDVKLAIGGQFRREAYTDLTSLASPTAVDVDKTRNVYALFSELFIPVIGEDNRSPGFERLEFTIAGRYEDYNDFGSSTNPKFGALWSPVEGLNLRGTYGTSFRAPLLRELAENNLAGVLFTPPNPADPMGSTLTLLAFGNNADLGPEKATTWTVGFDVQPPSIENLKIGVSYFNIKFKDRIDRVNGFFDIYTNPRFASLIGPAPDAAMIAKFTTPPAQFLDFTGGLFLPSDAVAFFDARFLNTAQSNTDGLDLIVNYNLKADSGSWGFDFNGTYLFKKEVQLFDADPFFDVVSTPYNPIDLKMRGGLSWAKDGFGAGVTVSYVNSYKDDRVTPALDVNSWTTVDARLSYNTGDRFGGALDNTLFALSAINIFDQDPPFVAGNSGGNVNYDPDNASALGRFISFQITKQW